MRWVKLTLPPRLRARWLLMTTRLSMSSLAGTARTLGRGRDRQAGLHVGDDAGRRRRAAARPSGDLRVAVLGGDGDVAWLLRGRRRLVAPWAQGPCWGALAAGAGASVGVAAGFAGAGFAVASVGSRARVWAWRRTAAGFAERSGLGLGGLRSRGLGGSRGRRGAVAAVRAVAVGRVVREELPPGLVDRVLVLAGTAGTARRPATRSGRRQSGGRRAGWPGSATGETPLSSRHR